MDQRRQFGLLRRQFLQISKVEVRQPFYTQNLIIHKVVVVVASTCAPGRMRVLSLHHGSSGRFRAVLIVIAFSIARFTSIRWSNDVAISIASCEKMFMSRHGRLIVGQGELLVGEQLVDAIYRSSLLTQGSESVTLP